MKYILLFIFTISCSHSIKKRSHSFSQESKDRYNELVANHTRGEEKYDGLYNIYHVHMTILTPQIHDSQIDLLTDLFKWNDDKIRKYKEDLEEQTSEKTLVFISFYTPNRKHNDLNRGNNSLWKVYLDHNGTRYPAKIKKDKHKFTYLKSLYPHHTRFNRAYVASFDIPTRDLIDGSSKLILTGAIGGSSFQF